MAITKEQEKLLNDALAASFDRETLRRIVKLELGEDLDGLVKPGAFKQQVFELVDWAVRTDRVEELIKGARAANPTSNKLAHAERILLEERRDYQYEITLNWAEKGHPDMSGFDLSDRDLSSLSITTARMHKAKLRGANLEKTNLSGTGLNGADLRDAILVRATMFGTWLNKADLSGADLREAKLNKAKYTTDTTWPDGFDPKAAGAILVDDDGNPIAEVSEIETVAGTYTDEKTGLEMIHIPAGEFIYGEDNRLEYLPEYWISKTPVTNIQYFRFVRETDHSPPKHWKGNSPRAAIKNHPVFEVSWHDARAYTIWAGMDLPTEQEWEKAARGPDGHIYPWGNEWIGGCSNTEEAGVGTTTPVGHYSPQGDSYYGCVDMVGNVWEWTATWYSDEKAWRVLRGGSWRSNQNHARAVSRYDDLPRGRGGSNRGFRAVVRRPLSE